MGPHRSWCIRFRCFISTFSPEPQAQAWAGQKKKHEALDAWRKAAELAPENAAVKEEIAKLEGSAPDVDVSVLEGEELPGLDVVAAIAHAYPARTLLAERWAAELELAMGGLGDDVVLVAAELAADKRLQRAARAALPAVQAALEKGGSKAAARYAEECPWPRHTALVQAVVASLRVPEVAALRALRGALVEETPPKQPAALPKLRGLVETRQPYESEARTVAMEGMARFGKVLPALLSSPHVDIQRLGCEVGLAWVDRWWEGGGARQRLGPSRKPLFELVIDGEEDCRFLSSVLRLTTCVVHAIDPAGAAAAAVSPPDRLEGIWRALESRKDGISGAAVRLCAELARAPEFSRPFRDVKGPERLLKHFRDGGAIGRGESDRSRSALICYSRLCAGDPISNQLINNLLSRVEAEHVVQMLETLQALRGGRR